MKLTAVKPAPVPPKPVGTMVDVVRHHGDLLDAGAELLPMLHAISTGDLCPSAYEMLARQIWKQLRLCWTSWWELSKVWDRADAWAEWQRCTGDWNLWKAAGLSELVRFWMEREDPPYHITHEEMTQVARWLYGTAYQQKDRPFAPPPFWAEEMLDPGVPGMEELSHGYR